MRRVLGYGRVEWDDLPWHDQKMYLDELKVHIDSQRSVGHPDLSYEPNPDAEAYVEDPAPEPMPTSLGEPPPGAEVTEGASQRPSWLQPRVTQVSSFG